MISTLILAAMVVAASLLPVSIIVHRHALSEAQPHDAAASPQQAHTLRDCGMCAQLRHPAHRQTRMALAAMLPGPRRSAATGFGHENGGC
ncbi:MULTISPECIES: hypothetical protein [unclassified Streptomyces]|uniref:hypothetical protein n=1 Tax=unclassified Streptomyces TaxID=2593676 RepID=UPI00093953F6|nr:hypothetical protein [Streptomyces sp. TSRI0281]OKI34953.1 hypothetical protein A6A29_16125 [Streptomyces sp. TSRI0281]